jgi:hypothetical protein
MPEKTNQYLPGEEWEKKLGDDSRRMRDALPSTEINSLEYKLNGRQVDILGLNHVYNTFVENEAKLDLFFLKHRMVLVENAPTAENWFSKEAVEAIAKYLKQYNLNSAVENWGGGVYLPKAIEIKTHEELAEAIVKYNFFGYFYRKLEELAEKNGTMLAVADPQTVKPYEPLETIEKFSQANLNAKQKSLLKTLLVLPSGAYLTHLIIHLGEKMENATRRDFIKTSIKGGVSAVAAAVGLKNGLSYASQRLNNKDDIAKYGRVRNPLGIFLNTSNDYRDTAVGLALSTLSKQGKINFSGPLGVVYGDGHVDGIKHYSKSPIETGLKLNSYLNSDFASQGVPRIKIYKPNGKDVWQKLVDEPVTKDSKDWQVNNLSSKI